MTSDVRFRLTFAGFLLVYFAVMGSLVVLNMALFDGIRPFVFKFVMLPAAIVGAVFVGIEKFSRETD